jgi:hypothetical protein
MPHLDPDRLVLLALNEVSPDARESEHLAGCDDCRAELTATRETVGLARRTDGLRDLDAPPEELWERIAAQAFATAPAGLADAAPTAARPAGSARPPRARVRVPRTPATGPAGRSRSRWRLALVALAAAVIGVAGTVAVQSIVRRDADRVVALASLAPQPAAPATAHGAVQVVDTGHGLQLRVTLSGMPAPAGYYTVWLYDGGQVMIPVGSPGTAPLNVPAAADNLDVFRIVDVSAQNLGQQEHGTSMLQGVLRHRPAG